jgi:glycosyltransferase involved in cell wall biosynthesis
MIPDRVTSARREFAIGVDATFVRHGRGGGAQQMLENLLEGLRGARENDDRLIVFGWGTNRSSMADGGTWIDASGPGNRFAASWRIMRRYERQLDAILFPNYFTPPRTRRRSPRVVTVIHDLQYLYFPETFSRRKRAWLRGAHAITMRVADVVVTISEHVRQDVLSRYGARWEEKVVAIPNPISWDRLERGETTGVRQRVVGGATGHRYVLSVSAQYPHKNLETLLRAFAILRGRTGYDDVTLVVAGQWGNRLIGIARWVDLRRVASELGLGDAVRFTGYVADGDLGELYQGATVFVLPSLFEGFGMPAAEALGFGLPVLTTRRTALPETTLGLAEYLDDPLDADAMATRIAEIVDHPDRFRPTADAVGRVRAAYATERIGRLYRDVLAGGSG